MLEIARVTKPTGSIFVHNISTAPMGKRLQPAHYGILFYAKDKKQNKFHQIRYPHKRCRKCEYLLKDYGGKKNMLHPFSPLIGTGTTAVAAKRLGRKYIGIELDPQYVQIAEAKLT